MIRITEQTLQRHCLKLKLEGSLTHETLDVLDETLKSYGEQGVEQVQLQVDGLVSVDRLAVQDWYKARPTVPLVSFCTSKTAVQVLLESCAIEDIVRDRLTT